jgi:hypothetical protein
VAVMKTAYLVIRPDCSVRAVTRLSRLKDDEVAVRLRLNFPDSWGHTIGEVTINLPDTVPTVTPEVIP